MKISQCLTFLLVSFLGLICYRGTAQKLPIFNAQDQPQAPDYSNSAYWSALPFRTDKADVLPYGETWISDSLKDVDVFYIYPTLYAKGKTWCADVNNKRLNKRLDNLPVKFQASTFNHIARVYAPRYRQGIVKCFTDTTPNAQLALDFAYQDVKIAFEYYLKNYNQGRPIIIASHSQGTTHSRRLLKEYFDNSPLRQRLVCAYSVGYAMYPINYEILKPCADSLQTGCYVTWSSFKQGYIPAKDSKLVGQVCVNPITWKMDTLSVTAKEGIFLKVGRKKRFTSTIRIKENWLWVKTNTPFIRSWKVMHLMDYNLFWHQIRHNATVRVNAFWKH